MIRNFEEFTGELTEAEKNYVLPRLFKVLTLAVGKDQAITNKEIINYINNLNPMVEYDAATGSKKYIKTSEPRIRHMIHLLRTTDVIPFLIATSSGYYISDDREEIETYIGSIDDRLRAIYNIRRALRRQLKTIGRNSNAIQKEFSFIDDELKY